jgi:hypothetical protein
MSSSPVSDSSAASVFWNSSSDSLLLSTTRGLGVTVMAGSFGRDWRWAGAGWVDREGTGWAVIFAGGGGPTVVAGAVLCFLITIVPIAFSPVPAVAVDPAAAVPDVPAAAVPAAAVPDLPAAAVPALPAAAVPALPAAAVPALPAAAVPALPAAAVSPVPPDAVPPVAAAAIADSVVPFFSSKVFIALR